MDWATVKKNTYFPICQTLFPPPPPPWGACAVQRQFRDRECSLRADVSYFICFTRKMEKAKEIGDVCTQASGNGELSKVIADIAQGDGNVLFLFYEH